jgi:hypothetical protein
MSTEAWIFVAMVWLGGGIACRNLAMQKGREPVLAFIMGFTFPLLAIIYYLTVPKNATHNRDNK